MAAIIHYFQEFFQAMHRSYLVACTLLAAVLVLCNYRWGIEPKWLATLQPRPLRFLGFYALYLLAFGTAWLLYFLLVKPGRLPGPLLAFLLLAPAVFALKVTAGGWQDAIRSAIPGNTGRYWAIVADWPLRFCLTVILLWCCHRWFVAVAPAPAWAGFPRPTGHGLTDMGFTVNGFTASPYAWLLLAVVPLVAFAATQSAFLQAYPRVQVLRFLAPGGPKGWQKLLYELAYGLDFFSIELFFRGFLVVLLCRWMGPAAVMPMAVFYCSIHFGKPLLECISSYFGGILLGVIACYSQSILGGILVHLGLAWMMEIAASAGHYFAQPKP